MKYITAARSAPSISLLLGLALIGSSAATSQVRAAAPYVQLGPASNVGTSQPLVRVAVRSPAGSSFGPANGSRFLLDTGANGILVAAEAYAELRARGYTLEGTFREQGITGFTEFDLSARYTFAYTDAAGQTLNLEEARLLSSASTSFCQLGLCPFYGILGMPGMTGRVVSLDLTSGSLLDAIGAGTGILNTFGTELPPSANRFRYTVPLTAVKFDAVGDIVPTWADLPFLKVDPVHQGKRGSGQFVLDTGAQLSLLSPRLAFELGLDANGNGSLADEAVGTIPIGGVGGTINAPQLRVDELRIPTEQGVDLVLSGLQFAIIEIDEAIDGVFGMNLLGGGDDLLGGILGGGSGDNYYETAHFDFRNMPTRGTGTLVLDLFNQFGDVTIPAGSHGDLNADGVLDFEDRMIWVVDVNKTTFGDSNLDGAFNSSDLVTVFAAGQYEDRLLKNSMWATGDWNGDEEFSTQDLVLAFQTGGYTDAATRYVPEPTPPSLALAALFVLGIRIPTRQRGAGHAAKRRWHHVVPNNLD